MTILQSISQAKKNENRIFVTYPIIHSQSLYIILVVILHAALVFWTKALLNIFHGTFIAT